MRERKVLDDFKSPVFLFPYDYKMQIKNSLSKFCLRIHTLIWPNKARVARITIMGIEIDKYDGDQAGTFICVGGKQPYLKLNHFDARK